jgi:hypothetical protein
MDPRMRSKLAENALLMAKGMLAEARARLEAVKLDTNALQNAFVYMNHPEWKQPSQLQEIQSARHAEYLDAYKNYLIALMEYERLRNEASMQPAGGTTATARRTPGPIDAPTRPDAGPQRRLNRSSATPTEVPGGKIYVKPSKKAIRQALEMAAREQAQGREHKASALLDAAFQAARVRLRKSIDDLRNAPSNGNIRVALADMAIVQALGDDPQLEDRAMNSVKDAATELDRKADQAFRKVCTKENFSKRVEQASLLMMAGGDPSFDLPPNVTRRLPPGSYKIGRAHV